MWADFHVVWVFWNWRTCLWSVYFLLMWYYLCQNGFWYLLATAGLEITVDPRYATFLWWCNALPISNIGGWGVLLESEYYFVLVIDINMHCLNCTFYTPLVDLVSILCIFSSDVMSSCQNLFSVRFGDSWTRKVGLHHTTFLWWWMHGQNHVGCFGSAPRVLKY